MSGPNPTQTSSTDRQKSIAYIRGRLQASKATLEGANTESVAALEERARVRAEENGDGSFYPHYCGLLQARLTESNNRLERALEKVEEIEELLKEAEQTEGGSDL